jgi:hypothetical protein
LLKGRGGGLWLRGIGLYIHNNTSRIASNRSGRDFRTDNSCICASVAKIIFPLTSKKRMEYFTTLRRCVD